MCNFIETINLFYVATNIRDILVNTFKLESELAEKDRVSTFLIFFFIEGILQPPGRANLFRRLLWHLNILIEFPGRLSEKLKVKALGEVGDE